LRKLAPQAAKTKTSILVKAKKPAKNDEIADSDDGRNTTTRNGTPAKSQPSALAEASPSDDSSSDSDSEPETKLKSAKGEQKVRANGVQPTTTASSATSSTSDSESDSEEDGGDEDSSSEDEEPKKALAEKTTAAATAEEDSSDNNSGSESDSESETEPATKQRPAKPANGTSITTTSETSSSEESDDEETTTKQQPAAPIQGQSAASDSDDDSSEDADVSMHIADRQQSRQAAVPDFIAPDFVLRKGDDGSNGQDVARICNQATSQGKQVWYFTVPANVPISVVQNMEFPMNQSQTGGVFSHEGQDYGISMDSMAPKSSIQILIPSADGSRYQSGTTPAPNSRVMFTRRLTKCCL
jgi:hypothetical protein